MTISSLELKNFRSYKQSVFNFTDDTNIILGPNAVGKTNILEAINYLCRGNSFRAKDVELIMFDQPWSRLDGVFDGVTRTVKLTPLDNLISKEYIVDDKSYKRLSTQNQIPVVVFEPNHINAVTKGPEHRRELIDNLIINSKPELKSVFDRYKRTLAQRNRLLKLSPTQAASQLFVWDLKLAELGEQIAEARDVLVVEINKSISDKYSAIAGHQHEIQASYHNMFPVSSYASKMVSRLTLNRELDFVRGFTTSGPHREDISFSLNGRLVGETASRGEARTLMLALKKYELDLLEISRGQKPIFLLDDVFSELDKTRRTSMLKNLKGYQIILTTTDADSDIFKDNNKYHKINLSKKT